MISILKCRHPPVKINQSNVKLFSLFRFRDAITTFNYTSNGLINKFKEWYIYFSGPNETKHLKEILIKQEHLQNMQEERREVSKHLTDARKSCIEKQDKIFKLNRWENVQEYVTLRREEAELLKKEYELMTKFESLDKTEKELFAMLNKTVLCSYEREKTKKVYTQYLGIILSIVIVMLSVVITKIANVGGDRIIIEKPFYITDDIKITMDESGIIVAIVIGVMFIILKTCM